MRRARYAGKVVSVPHSPPEGRRATKSEPLPDPPSQTTVASPKGSTTKFSDSTEQTDVAKRL